MSGSFRPESFDALVIDGNDWVDGRLELHYTLRGPDPVSFAEVIDFGDVGAAPDPLLARLLTRKFGSLDEATENRLRNASTDEINRWTDQILVARTLEEVFRLQ